jgi:hypothetical protein|tara:strand:- start:1366 stop:1488 length:123 start_codon:yes stop_codon:yes gene_type:complete
MKKIYNAMHEWIGRQPVLIQLSIAFCTMFLVLAFLIAAFE